MAEGLLRVVWCCMLLLVAVAGKDVLTFDQCFPDTPTTQQNGVRTPNFDFSGVDRFGLGLFRNLTANIGDGNLVVSPYSIWSMLSLALMGAEGNTRTQLQQALGLSGTKRENYNTITALKFVMSNTRRGGPQMNRVDRAYFSTGLEVKPCISHVLQDVEIIDFGHATEAAARINDAVSRGTGGEITELLQPQDIVNALFVLLNAIYFKGSWESPFDRHATNSMVFYNSLGEEVAAADTMSRQGRYKIVLSPELGATVLMIPYKNSDKSLVVLLPNLENPSVSGVLAALTPEALTQALDSAQTLIVKVLLPKFDFKTKLDDELIQSLSILGLTDMFQVTKANFTGFTSGRTPIYVDTVIHQAKVKVDEEGTTAAAATVAIGNRSGPGRAFNFIVNRPFIFLIYDNRFKMTLFAGVVNNPTLSG